ncbi:MAG: amino acid permease [Deltaproteobacteria bacterium]|nr:amino acid permease [Deltaproteobacteria bacterium]
MGAPLERSLGAWSAMLLTVGAMVGTGILATPTLVAKATSSPALFVALWIAGGVVSLLGAFTYAELGTRKPETGGLFVYLRDAFHPLVAFVFGWTMLVVLVPSSVAFFAQVTGSHLGPPIAAVTGADPWTVSLIVSLVALLLIALVNVLGGARGGAVLQNAATILKVVGLGFLVVLALLLVLGGPGATTVVEAPVPSPPPETADVSWLAVIAALVPVFWAYDGWIDVTSVAGELRNPERDVPRSLVWGVLAVTFLYLIVSGAFLAALGAASLARTEAPALELARATLGPSGPSVAAAIAATCTFGAGAVGLMSGARVVYAMARDGNLFAFVARADRHGSPSAAVGVTSVLALGYLVIPQLGSLAATFVVGAWPFYALGALALLVLRARGSSDSPLTYRTPLYPFTVLAFVAASLAVVGSYAIENPAHTALSFGLALLGLPIGLLRGTGSTRSTH